MHFTVLWYIRFSHNANKGGLLNIDSPIPVGENENENGDIEWKTTCEALLEKHPHARPPVAETLLTAPDIDELCHDLRELRARQLGLRQTKLRVRLVHQEVMRTFDIIFVRHSKVPRLIYEMRWQE